MQDAAQVLAEIVGENHLKRGQAIDERFRVDMSRRYTAEPAYFVRPASVAEVAQVVKLAAEHHLPITVVGGMTSTVGGSVAQTGGISLSLERMNQVVEIDTTSMTMTVDAGCVLQTAQEAAEAEGALLPLDLGARGSATIGGVIGTNAGGNRVVRWGMMRDMVIGLEAVLADGTVVSSLTKMLKDNAGYNWKHLLIGSEGTLAIVTRAVLRLRPLPNSRQTAIVAVPHFEAAVNVLRRLERTLGGQLSSFELMWDSFYERMTTAQLDKRPRPLPVGSAFYILLEAMGGNPASDQAQFEGELATLIEDGVITDAVIAQSDRERDNIWAVREDMSPGLTPLRPFTNYDVSMGLRDMPAFIAKAQANIAATLPEATALFYGHAGDGNLHVILSVGTLDAAIRQQMDVAVFSAVRDVGGSVAAEHGIGVSRAPFLSWTRSSAELALMRTLKDALDPQHLLNPGKLLDAM